MFPTWRLQIREARTALEEGRWEEASALLRQDSLRGFLPTKQLSRQVASRLVGRARQRLQGGDSLAGWKDVQQAAQLGGCDDQIVGQIDDLRQSHAGRGLNRVRHLLLCGEARLASEQLRRLEKQHLGGEEFQTWKQVTRLLIQSDQQAARGETAAAEASLGRVAKLLPAGSDDFSEQTASRRAKLTQLGTRLQQLSTELHQAVGSEAWNEALQVAQLLLELAPEHPAARQAQSKAWKGVGLDSTRVPQGRPPKRPIALRSRNLGNAREWAQSTRASRPAAQVDTVTTRNSSNLSNTGKRIVAWIDGVGGYLLCLDDEVVLGQPSLATEQTSADIPIRGDLSRRHATLRRDGESYVLLPIHNVSVDGTPLAGPTLLRSGAVICLGDTVKLQFCRPHALSATATLTLQSHHKTEPSVDSIVLMSESCILGPQSHSHIQCRNWTEPLVLIRRGKELVCRAGLPLEIDGRACTTPEATLGNCRIESEEFALTLEEI